MFNSFIDQTRAAFDLLELKDFAIRRGRCPGCGPSVFIRLNRSDWGIRCIRCGGAPNTLSIIAAVTKYVQDLKDCSIYIISKSGPLFDFLNRCGGNLTYSYFDEDVPSGEYHDGTQCQNVEHLTYSNSVFDLCVHSEVFEHVPDDRAGFTEILRVLKPGGYMIFTVPVFNRLSTKERATMANGELCHLAPAIYHNDQFRGRVLVYRDYGTDIVGRIKASGFTIVEILTGYNPTQFKFRQPGFDRPVIIARKTGSTKSPHSPLNEHISP